MQQNLKQQQNLEPQQSSLSFNSKDNWDDLSYNIPNVKDGTELTDDSNMSQTLTRPKHWFLQGKHKYGFIKAEENKWDVKSRILKNIKKGVELSDAAAVEQTLLYNVATNKFLLITNISI